MTARKIETAETVAHRGAAAYSQPALRRWLTNRHAGMTRLELFHGKELVTSWSVKEVEAWEHGEPNAPDLMVEIQQEAQAFAEAIGTGSALLTLRTVKTTGDIIASRPVAAQPVSAARPAVDGEVFERMCQAVLKSNEHVIACSRGLSDGVERIVKAQAEVCEALARVNQQRIEPAHAAEVVALTEEQREELVQRTELVRAAVKQLPDVMQLLLAVGGKFLGVTGEVEAPQVNGLAS